MLILQSLWMLCVTSQRLLNPYSGRIVGVDEGSSNDARPWKTDYG